MKLKFIFFLLMAGNCLFAQTEDVLAKLTRMNYGGENMKLSVSSKNLVLGVCKFKILNAKGEVVKTIELPKAETLLVTVLNMESVDVGQFTYQIIRSDKVICQGEFTRDAFDDDAVKKLLQK